MPSVWLAVAVGSVAAYQLTFFGGVKLAGVALGTAVGIGSAPLWGGLVDGVFLGWRPSRRWLVAAAIALVGVALVAGEPGDAENPALGLLLAVGAGASYALYAFALQRLTPGADADHVAASVFTRAAILLLPVLLIGDAGELLTGRGAAMSLHLGIIATTLSYALFTRGVRDTPVSTATLLSLAEPLTAVVLGVLVVDEVLEPAAVVGVVLNLAVWFTIYTLFADVTPLRRFGAVVHRPVGGSLDVMAAVITIGALVAVFRFHVPTLRLVAAAAVVGVAHQLLT